MAGRAWNRSPRATGTDKAPAPSPKWPGPPEFWGRGRAGEEAVGAEEGRHRRGPGLAQARRGQELRVRQEGLRRADADARRGQHRGVVGPADRQVDVVRGHDHRGAGRAQARQDVQQPLLTVRVQARRRLVQDQHPRSHRHRAGYRRALALPVREQVRRAVPQRRDVQRGERRVHPGPDLVRRQPQVHRAEGDVLLHRGREQLVVRVLDHQLHRGAQPDQPRPVVRDRRPVEAQRPRPGPQAPLSSRISVVLPLPLRPSRTSARPSAMAKSTSDRTAGPSSYA